MAKLVCYRCYTIGDGLMHTQLQAEQAERYDEMVK